MRRSASRIFVLYARRSLASKTSCTCQEKKLNTALFKHIYVTRIIDSEDENSYQARQASANLTKFALAKRLQNKAPSSLAHRSLTGRACKR